METMTKWRNVWCMLLLPAALEGLSLVPSTYRRAREGEDRRPGTYGEGIAGEALVCLLPEDSGEWFARIACKEGKGCRHSVAL